MPDGFDEPPAPYDAPSGAQDRFDWLRLIRSRRVGPATFHRLMGDHGSAAAVLAALPGIAAAAGVENYATCPEGVVRAEIAAAKAAGARLLCRGEPDYPAAFLPLSDAPPLLWAIGNTALLNRPSIALVGARNASSLGLRMARRLAEGLADQGHTVVSGLARGIDAEAHRASLSGGTVAVMAGGVDVIYPPENAALAEQIAAQGCRISENPMGMEPQTRHFPQRNRLIAGLSRAVVVVEAAAKSGSLLTARAALDIGREVLAVPGHPMDPRAEGCNILIRDGATLVRGIADVIAALGPQKAAQRVLPIPQPEPPRRTLADIGAVHGQILARLGPSPLPEDQLIRDLDLPAAAVAAELVNLELDGRIERQAGGMLARVG